MARVTLLGAVVLALLASAAAPASASTRISWYTRPAGYIPPFWAPYQRIIALSGDSGVNHDIVVKPSGAQQLWGYPQVVDVYDYGDTLVPGSGNPCRIYSSHHAACLASGGPNVADNPYSYTSYSEIDIATGDGNDSVEVGDPLNPIIALVGTGAGDDQLKLSGVWDWYYKGGGQSLGPGNDFAQIGPEPPAAPPFGNSAPATGNPTGLHIFAGSGDDTLDTLNGSLDTVLCDDGNDTLVADPLDSNYWPGYYGPPISGDCETRTALQ